VADRGQDGAILDHDHEQCPKRGMRLLGLTLVNYREHRLAHSLTAASVFA